MAKTRIGVLVRAGASNREMATAMGVDVTRLFTLVFGIGAALCAVAGALLGPLLAVQVGMGENILILAFVVIVIGGIGSIRGALVGAILVGCVDTLGRTLLQHVAARVPAAAMGQRRRPGDRLDRDLRVDGGGAGGQAAGPVPGARLMRPPSSRCTPQHRRCVALVALRRPAAGSLQRSAVDFYLSFASRIADLRDRRDQPEPGARLRRHGLLRPRRVRRPRRLRDRHPDQRRRAQRRWVTCWRRSLVAGAAAALAIGAISLRTRGVYFIMITLAFAQMMFYLVNSMKGYGGDEGLNIRARSAHRLRAST